MQDKNGGPHNASLSTFEDSFLNFTFSVNGRDILEHNASLDEKLRWRSKVSLLNTFMIS